MTTDIGILLNLACVKYTGQSLPSNAETITAWTWSNEDAKRKGKFNPYVDNLLTNPFKVAYDYYPIEHKIKRSLINDAILNATSKTLTPQGLLKVMCGESFPPVLTSLEVRNLMITRNNFIQYAELLDGGQHYCSFYDTINEKKYDDKFGYSDNEKFWIMIASNPQLKTVLDKVADGSKDRNKVKEILKRYKKGKYDYEEKYQGVNNAEYHNNYRSNHQQSQYHQSIRIKQTRDDIPSVKQVDWMPWFWWYINSRDDYQQERYYGGVANSGSKLNLAHFKRSKAGGKNFWRIIADSSGKYNRKEKSPQDKKDYEQRLVNCILTQ